MADIILTSPGLSVINEAMKQARFTFARMKSYATFRIAETIRIILFMTLSIVVFDFYPITALMIILLALLNDIPILVISSLLGISGVVASFVLFFLLREQGFPEEMIRTFLFLKLVVAGHSTVYVTRSEGWFWQRPWPSPLLLGATFGTEILGTLVAATGLFVTPIGWTYAVLIWIYALLWFVFNDAVKMLATRLLLQKNRRDALLPAGGESVVRQGTVAGD